MIKYKALPNIPFYLSAGPYISGLLMAQQEGHLYPDTESMIGNDSYDPLLTNFVPIPYSSPNRGVLQKWLQDLRPKSATISRWASGFPLYFLDDSFMEYRICIINYLSAGKTIALLLVPVLCLNNGLYKV